MHAVMGYESIESDTIQNNSRALRRQKPEAVLSTNLFSRYFMLRSLSPTQRCGRL